MTKPIRFDLYDLKLFVATVENGSLSKAAQILPLALSAASARIKALEERLGIELLQRGPRGVVATSAGQLFYDHALRLLQAAQDTQRGMDALSGRGRVKLRLLSNTTGMSTQLPAQLASFLVTNPEIDLQFDQSSSREVLKAVAAGHADLGIVDGDYSQRELLYLLYQRNQLVVIAHPESPLARLPRCGFADWLKQPLVGLQADSSLQQFLQRMAVLAHSAAQFRVTAPNSASVAQMVAQNIGVAIVARPLAEQYQRQLGVILIELDEPWANRELNVCLRPTLDTRLPALRLARYLAGVEG